MFVFRHKNKNLIVFQKEIQVRVGLWRP